MSDGNTGLPSGRGRLALTAVGAAMMLSTLSMTSINVALPVMAQDLRVLPATAVWIVSAFQLALLATIFPFSALGDAWGFRKTFVSGLVLVTLASIYCAFASSLQAMIAGRIFHALGTAAVMAVNPALLRLSVPASRFGHALGINAMIVAVSSALGPSVAAIVLTLSDWHVLFLLNVPIAIVAGIVGLVMLPGNLASEKARFDLRGAALSICTFVLLAIGLDRVVRDGWLALPYLIALALVATWLVADQRSKSSPMLPLDLLHVALVRRCACASVFAFAAQMTAMVALPFLLHDVFHRSMVATGAAMMAWPITVGLMAPAAAWAEARRQPSWLLCSLGMATMAVGLVFLAWVPASTSDTVVVLLLTLCGLGFGAFQTPNNRAMLGATPLHRSGGAGGLQATARLTGQMLGASFVGVAYRYHASDARMAAVTALSFAALFAALAAGLSFRRRR